MTTHPVDIPEPNAEWRSIHLGLDESHPKVARMAANAEWFARASLRNNRVHGHWLVLAGRTGCGKTHTAERVAAYVARRQVDAWSRGWLTSDHLATPVFVRWTEACKWTDLRWEDFMSNEVRPSRMVVVDDIGAEGERYKNGENEVRLQELLEASDGKWLLATTNVPQAEWLRWGQRVADRLSQARYLSLFEVPSYRLKR